MRKLLTADKNNIEKRFVATRANGCLDNPFEMTVLEFSDSGKYVKWRNVQNLIFWDLTADFEILDTITPNFDFEELCININKRNYE